MAEKYLELMVTPAVAGAERHYFGRAITVEGERPRDALTEAEASFIKARDSFYLATVTETGWPYMQHRGGAPGFLHVLNSGTLAFADYQGNRQLLSTGNLATNDRVSLFLMDYPHRTRLKILGHARVEDAREHRDLADQLAGPEMQRKVERVFLIDVVSFDWNCPQYITPRYTLDELEAANTAIAGTRKPPKHQAP